MGAGALSGPDGGGGKFPPGGEFFGCQAHGQVICQFGVYFMLAPMSVVIARAGRFIFAVLRVASRALPVRAIGGSVHYVRIAVPIAYPLPIVVNQALVLHFFLRARKVFVGVRGAASGALVRFHRIHCVAIPA